MCGFVCRYGEETNLVPDCPVTAFIETECKKCHPWQDKKDFEQEGFL